jgi:glycosyltransferase involved in cell wall biosynthesis
MSRSNPLPVVLIGPTSDDPAESVSGVNRAFMEGLSDVFDFVALESTRNYGNTRQARLNPTNGLYFLQQLFRWCQQLKRRRPGVAHYAISCGWAMEKGLFFMRMARLFGAKTLGHLHSGGFIDHWQGLPAWRRRMALRQLSKLDGLVLASEWWRQEIGKHVALPSTKLYVVNNPIAKSFEEAVIQIPVERSEARVLSLGVLGRPKGVLDILEGARIAAEQASFQILLAGAEREPGILRQVNGFLKSNGLGQNVEVKPPLSSEDKIECFRRASIFLLPSYYENFPLVLVEAAAAGHAIVATPVGAVPEFFKNGVSAIFVEPGRPDQIAAALSALANNPEQRNRLGRAAREVFTSRLARSRIMESLAGVYRQVLAEQRA